MDIINTDRPAAADLFIRTEKSRLSTETISSIIQDQNIIAFSPTPRRVMPFAEYMLQNGMIKNKPASWKDIFFPNVYGLNGS
jgi:NitT/TauT family transport system substrate-binding protein